MTPSDIEIGATYLYLNSDRPVLTGRRVVVSGRAQGMGDYIVYNVHLFGYSEIQGTAYASDLGPVPADSEPVASSNVPSSHAAANLASLREALQRKLGRLNECNDIPTGPALAREIAWSILALMVDYLRCDATGIGYHGRFRGRDGADGLGGDSDDR